MNTPNSLIILGTAFVAVFLEAAFNPVRHWFGAQIDLLPALMVYAALSSDLVTVVALAVLGGLWFDALSANPLGVSILPLFLPGFLLLPRRDVILRDQFMARIVLGLGASAAVPLMTLLILLHTRQTPVLGWELAWSWIVMTLGGGLLTPVCFKMLDRLNFGLRYQPRTDVSFRPDREIRGEPNMPVFGQLKKDDGQSRLLSVVIFGGLLLLLAGVWWVQIVSSKYYQEKLEIQATRTVRVPAVRGKILDRNGDPLAETRPNYTINLYLEELTKNFEQAYTNARNQILQPRMVAREKQLGRRLTPEEKKKFHLPTNQSLQLQQDVRYLVVSNLLVELSARLNQPVAVTRSNFDRSFKAALAMPLPVLNNLNPGQVGRFEEQAAFCPAMALEAQPIRSYPNGPLAAHLLGYLVHDTDSLDGEISDYNFRLDDYKGETGIESLYDTELRGHADSRSVVINNLGYRQGETSWSPSELGDNVVLTIDLEIQKAAEEALQKARHYEKDVRGAVVVMDARNGDVLALASAPNYDPNHFVQRHNSVPWEQQRWDDKHLGVQRNRAIYENYHPGSIFKIVVGMAALEVGELDPHEFFHSDGYYTVGRAPKQHGDTAGAGDFDFNRAMAKSSNTYFVHHGTNAGVLEKVISLGQHLHLGERTGVMPRQETAGNFPTLKRISHNWNLGDTANVSIGQGELDVTPLQMAVMTAAVANGGKVFKPRLISRIESPDNSLLESFPEGVVRDNLGVSAHTLRIVRDGMLADVESAEGSGHGTAMKDWRIAGKTGTAEVENRSGHIEKILKDTWFVSYAPEENPRYVVVTAVEGGISGAITCVPIARKIYQVIQQQEQKPKKENHARKDVLAVIK